MIAYLRVVGCVYAVCDMNESHTSGFKDSMLNIFIRLSPPKLSNPTPNCLFVAYASFMHVPLLVPFLGWPLAAEQALGDVFYRQNPSAPPMSRGGSSTSWSIHRRKGSDLSSSSDLSQRNQWQDKLKPLPPPKEGRPLSIPAPLRWET